MNREPLHVQIEYLADAPQADVDLDMRLVDAAVMRGEDGELLLVLRDTYVTVVLEPGLGHHEECVTRAERLASAALRYAELMRAQLDDMKASPAASAAGARSEDQQMEVEKEGAKGDLADVRWRTSSRSGPYSDNCVEVGLTGDLFAVRDSKNPTGPVLLFTSVEWTAFLSGVAESEFTAEALAAP